MLCPRCGSEVAAASRYCPSCGLDLTAMTPVATSANGEDTSFAVVRDALAEEYELLEELGRGGMAIVYRARERLLEREVAVKVLPFSLGFDREFVERFQREARTSAQLEHPNIVPIYRVGQAGRVSYFVMKYLRGGSLARLLKERGRVAAADLHRILVDAACALGYAAQRGIIHRDLKPDNILFDDFGHSLLADFGIARAADGRQLTQPGILIGTPHYMSPEQARGQPLDVRSDLYSLGVVAYTALAGRVPFDGEDSYAIGYKHLTEAVPVPPLDDEVAERLWPVIERMLAKQPAERFQSCEALLDALTGDAMPALRTSVALARRGPVLPTTTGPLVDWRDAQTAPIAITPVDRRARGGDRRGGVRRTTDRQLRRERLVRRLSVGLAVSAIAAVAWLAGRTSQGAGARGGAEVSTLPAAAPVDETVRDLCSAPGPDYNAENICFDRRPVPQDAFVPVTGGGPLPTASTLWVKVDASGRAVAVAPYKPSNSEAFERAARAYALSIAWTPARKAGQPVEGWTQWPFMPVAR